MSNYKIGLQVAKGGYRVVIFSADNGKLVFPGEALKNLKDAMALMDEVKEAWNGKTNRIEMENLIIPAGHKWPKNSGPKKKAAPNKKVAKKAAVKKKK